MKNLAQKNVSLKGNVKVKKAIWPSQKRILQFLLQLLETIEIRKNPVI